VTPTELSVLSPLITLAAAAVLVMLMITVVRDHRVIMALTILGLVVALILLPITSPLGTLQVTQLLIFDGFARFYIGMLLFASIGVALLAPQYLERQAGEYEEFYVLLLLATLGSSVLVASTHFASFFLGLEILSVSLYAMIAYRRVDERSIEAGIKYLVLAATSSAFLLFGMALIYAQSGTMSFGDMRQLATIPGNTENVLLLAGFGLLIIGFGFKLAVVPFHMWAPDVYQGAPVPVTAYIATVSKGSMFGLLLRYFNLVDVQAFDSLYILFGVIAVASIVIGSLLALLQNNVKRILAYSSIAHLGYLLVGFLSGPSNGVFVVTFYLVAYFASSLAAFGVIGILSGPERDAELVEDYRGLYTRHSWLAFFFALALFSLSGIPITAGFVGEFFILQAGARASAWWLVIAFLVGIAISLYYYLRIIVAIYSQPREGETPQLPEPALPLLGALVLAVLVLVVLWLGFYPTPLVEFIQTTVANLL
jgi:NADH-quinone oxidoreductase subunit N